MTMRIILKVAVLLVFGCALCTAITVPLDNHHGRCMMVFTYGAQETIKLDLKFPRVAGRQDGEYFDLRWRNTQTHETSYDQVTEGPYRHEIHVNENVIYELCFRFKTSREVGLLRVEYHAHNQFYFSKENIKVPAGLLKSQDLEKTYLNALDIKQVGDRFIDMQKKREEEEESLFESTRSIGSKLVSMCRIELLIIAGTALYQLYAVRQYLSRKSFL